jgi:hypothetical protein
MRPVAFAWCWYLAVSLQAQSVQYLTPVSLGTGSAVAVGSDSSGNSYSVEATLIGRAALARPFGCHFTKLNPLGTATLSSGILIAADTTIDANCTTAIVDASGSIYAAGVVRGALSASPQAFQATRHGLSDAWAGKWDSSGNLIWLTYLGGSGDDSANRIGLDGAGNVYVAGTTTSVDFPLVNAASASISGGFLTKIKSDGSALSFSTYSPVAQDLAVDTTGLAFEVGDITAGALNVINPAQSACGIQICGFLSKYDSNGTIQYTTYLGSPTGPGTVEDVGAITVAVMPDGGVTAVFNQAIWPDYTSGIFAWVRIDGAGVLTQQTLANAVISPFPSASQLRAAADGIGNIYVVGFSGQFASTTFSHPLFPNGNIFTSVVIEADSSGAVVFSSPFEGNLIGVAVSARHIRVVGQGGTDIQQTDPSHLPGYFVTVNPILRIDPAVPLGFGFTFLGDISPTAAPALGVGPTALSFPTARVGSSVGPCLSDSVCRALKIQNIGSSDLTGLAIAVTGDFSQTNTCSTTLSAGGGYCTVSVMFSPTSVGSTTGSLNISSNATASPFTVPLTGSGGLPTVDVSPSSLTFPATNAGSTSLPQTVTLTNNGTWPLAISHIDVSASFAETTNCTANLNIGASCTISTTFTPVATGSHTGSLTISDDAAGAPHVVSLSGGGGTAIALSASSSTSLTINAGQTATFSFNVISPTGENDTVSFSCSGAPPSGSCVVTPPSTMLNGNGPVSITATVTTGPRTMSAMRRMRGELQFLAFGVVGTLVFSMKSRREVRTCFVLLLAGLSLVSCGGGNKSPKGPTTGTPSGKYIVTVTASSSTSAQSMAFTVTVN